MFEGAKPKPKQMETFYSTKLRQQLTTIIEKKDDDKAKMERQLAAKMHSVKHYKTLHQVLGLGLGFGRRRRSIRC